MGLGIGVGVGVDFQLGVIHKRNVTVHFYLLALVFGERMIHLLSDTFLGEVPKNESGKQKSLTKKGKHNKIK